MVYLAPKATFQRTQQIMFHHIQNESALLRMNVSRGDDRCLDLPDLAHQLKDAKVDVLKLTLSDSTPDLYLRLDALGLPYYVLGVTIEYRSVFGRNPVFPYLNSGLEFIEYKGEDPEMFKAMVASVFQHWPGSYYLNPGLCHLIDKHLQLQALVEYVAGLNSSEREGHYTHLLRHRGAWAGFVCSYKQGNGGGATYSGLLKQYENKGLYLDIIRFIQNYGKEIGQKWGTAHVQLQNTVGQKAFAKGGLFPSGHSLNVHVNCFYGTLAGTKTRYR